MSRTVYLVLFLIVIGLLLLKGLNSQILQKEDKKNLKETALLDWQEYKNDDYGFIFKYPKNFKLSVTKYNSRSEFSVMVYETDNDLFWLKLFVNPTLNIPSDSQFGKVYNLSLLDKQLKILNIQSNDKTYSNPQGAKFVAGKSSVVKSLNSSYYFQFSHVAGSNYSENYVNKILSSFKVIK